MSKRKDKKNLQFALGAVIAIIAIVLVVSVLMFIPGSVKENDSVDEIVEQENLTGYKVFRMQIIDMDVELTPEPGANESPRLTMNADIDALHFGRFPVTYEATRFITTHNEQINVSIMVDITVSGNISDLVTIDDTRFELEPYQEKEVEVKVEGYKGFPGKYSGEMEIMYYKKET